MKLDFTLAAAALLAGGVDGLDLKAEHAGGVISRVHGGKHWSDDGVINNGTASGETVSLGNGMILSTRCQMVYAYNRRNRICCVPASPPGEGCRPLPDRYLWQRAHQ